MIYIDIDSHNFNKQNIVTIIKGKQSYDIYKCEDCGLMGKREFLSNKILVKKDKMRCRYKIAKAKEIKQSKSVRVKDPRGHLAGNFGVKDGEILNIVPCPDEYKETLSNEIWVFCEQRNEPLRLLKGEYEIIN